MSEKQLTTTEVPADEKTKIEVLPFGTDEKILLNIKIVRDMIAVPTKSGKKPDDNECIKFMMLCRARHLNPFEGDAFLLGYDTLAGGPKFSLITAQQVFLKRAEASEGFNGIQSGVIVTTKDGPPGATREREGDLVLDDEILLGGWAKVYRRDRDIPFYKTLKLSTFNTGKSRWEKDPAGMIVKCAEADALRTAFPTHLGGLYVQEETPPIDITARTTVIQKPTITTGGSPTGGSDQPPSGGAAGPEPKKRGRKPKGDLPPDHPTKLSDSSSGPEQGPESPKVPISADRVTKVLTDNGYDPIDLVAIMVNKKFIDRPPNFDDNKPLTALELAALVPDEKLNAVLENWGRVAEIIDQERGGVAAARRGEPVTPLKPKPIDALFE